MILYLYTIWIKIQYFIISILFVIISDTKFDAKYILALLNSNLINWFYSTKFTNKSKLTVNISKTFLSLLPVKYVSQENQKSIIRLVDEITNNFQILERLDNNMKKTKTIKRIQELERKINDSIYEIYNLTNEDKQKIENDLLI